MPSGSRTDTGDTFSRDTRLRLAGGLFAAVLATRLFAGWYAGSPLPYYDQWVLDFQNTLLKIQHGAGLLTTLLWPHNEHLVVTEKLVTLAGFTLNGYWDVRFALFVAALVRGIESVALFCLLGAALPRRAAAIVWLAVLVVFAGPTSGYNLLCGMQVCFAFAELACVGALACTLSKPSWRSGLGVVFCTMFGLLSLASGAAIPAATAVAGLLARRPRSFWAWWALSAALAGSFVVAKMRDRAGASAPLFTAQRSGFLLELIAWPAPALALVILIIAVGFMAWSRRTARTPTAESPILAPVAGWGAFAFANVLLLALSRTPTDFHPRHWDSVALWALAVIAGFAASASLVTARRRVAWTVVAIVASMYVGAFATQIWPTTLRYVRTAREQRAPALTYYRHVLTSTELVRQATGEDATLDERGAAFFDDPVLRFTPHRGVYASIAREPLSSLSLLAPEILPTRPPSPLATLIEQLFHVGWIICAVGFFAVLLWPRPVWIRDRNTQLAAPPDQSIV